jgi:4-amino-4-deoxy-L-arabinose transferase-like glycosyltransferase
MQRLADRPRLALLAVLAVAAFVDLVAIRERLLISGDEAVYAAASREMLESGDWILPSFNGEPRYQKPPLVYWLIAGSYRVFGVSPGAARLPSALCGIATCALVFALGRRLGGPACGLASGLVMATNVGTLALSRVAMTDPILCAFTTAAIAGGVFARGSRASGAWLAFAFAALALGALTKGPIAIAVPALVFLPWAWYRGELSGLAPPRAWLAGALLFVAIAAPWFVAIHLRTHGAFTQNGLGFETVERFFGRAVSSVSLPWWGYALALWPAFLPWSAFLPAALLAPASRPGARDALFSLAAWWSLSLLVFFSLGATRVVTYLYPAFPAFALLVGSWWSRLAAEPGRSRSPLLALLALLLATLATLALLALSEGPARRVPAQLAPALRTALLALAAGLASACAIARLRPARELFAALVAGSALALAAAMTSLMPRVEALEATSEKSFGEWLRAHPEVRALSLDDHAPAICFYAGRRVERFGPREAGRFRAAFSGDEPAAAVVRSSHRSSLGGLDAAVIAESYRHVFVTNAAQRARSPSPAKSSSGSRADT